MLVVRRRFAYAYQTRLDVLTNVAGECGRMGVAAYLSLAYSKIAFCQGDKHQVHMQDTRHKAQDEIEPGKTRRRQIAEQVGRGKSREGRE